MPRGGRAKDVRCSRDAAAILALFDEGDDVDARAELDASLAFKMDWDGGELIVLYSRRIGPAGTKNLGHQVPFSGFQQNRDLTDKQQGNAIKH